MPKKEMTEAEKKAWGKKMAEARKKKAEPEVSDKVEIDKDDLNELLSRLKRLEEKDYSGSGSTAQVTPRGVIGFTDKYPVDPAMYPDFTGKLAKHPKLKQFAFDVNYELEYEVNITSYETREGVNTREPRFHLQLNKVVFDDDGNPTAKRIVVRKFVMHEDPQAALVIARDNGVDVDQSKELEFLNDMRYLRAEDWLLGLFYPAPISKFQKKRQEVIGGKLVDVFEINSESGSRIPFDKITNRG